MVKRPGFSERIFEFAFNAEFAMRHSSVMAACPGLPSLQEEKKLGYDVEFELKRRGGGKESLFLQHKVARFVTSRCGSNARFFDYAGGPYFAFSLDVDQYNLIHGLAKRRARRIYYCAPLCTARRTIDDNFLHKKICAQSVWFDVKNCGAITGAKSHSIVYSQNGNHAARFSEEPQELAVLDPMQYEPSGERHPRGLDRGEAEELYTDVFEELQEWWPARTQPKPDFIKSRDDEPAYIALMPVTDPPKRLSKNVSRAGFIEETANILAAWYGVTWLILGRHEPN